MLLEIAILAGGESSRMGQDKASVVIGGRTVLETIASTALATGLPVCVPGREQPALWTLKEVKFIPDDHRGIGPIGGLHTALVRTSADGVLLLACDMPKVSTSGLRWLAEMAQTLPKESCGIAVLNAGKIEPLFSVYTKACLPNINTMIAQGRRALHRLIQDCAFRAVEAPESLITGLANYNTPEEWATMPGFDTGEI